MSDEQPEQASQTDTDVDTDTGDDSTDAERKPGEAAEQFEQAPADAEIEEIERDRAERLDPDNRPDNVEIDNTQRDFDSEKGMFTDSEGYEEAEEQYPAEGAEG